MFVEKKKLPDSYPGPIETLVRTDWKNYDDQATAVRESSVSQHHRNGVKGPLKPHEYHSI